MDHHINYQVGGNHYATMKIHPDEFAMANCWDADAFSCLKYLSRYPRKHGLEDLEKAEHFVYRRLKFLNLSHRHKNVTSMAYYCTANGISGKQRQALIRLYAWVEGAMTSDDVLESIEELKQEYS